MKKSKRLGIIIMVLVLLLMPSMAACGGGDDETSDTTPTRTATLTPSPNPTTESSPEAKGPSWTWNVSYNDELTVWTRTVVGEEMVGGVDCHVYETFFDPKPVRSAEGSKTTRMTGCLSKTTLDPVRMLMTMDMEKYLITIDNTVSYTYQGEGHGAPYTVGKTWSYDMRVEMSPEYASPHTRSYQVKVVALEEVTVPAGTFNCYKIEETLTTVSGVKQDTPTLMRIQWISADDMFTVLKWLDIGHYEFEEKAELVSHTP